MDKAKALKETLRADIITTEQMVMLTSILDLSFEEIDGVAGGECSCVNCCSRIAGSAMITNCHFREVLVG